MYQALYRKYRPRTFDDVVGQREVTLTLKNQIMSGRTSHAYLFIGVRGTGKTTCAKILARALNCERPENGNPCNKCDSCLGIESGGVMDVVEIDAASNNGVENVRALREEAVFSPASVKKRVYIIDEVHMLTTPAFNALLKILEEPPEHLVFILATTEVHKVLPTIMSRCQRYSFKRISPDEIRGRLEYIANQEGIILEKDAAALLSRLADGSLRDGVSLLDQCSGESTVTSERVLTAMGLAGNFRIASLVERIAAGDSEAALAEFESLWRDGKSPATLLGEITSLLRDVMLLEVAPKGGAELLSGGFDDATLKSVSKRISVGEAMEFISIIQNSIGLLRDGRDPKIEAQLCIISLCEPELIDTPERLGLRITKLEKALEEGVARIPEASLQKEPPAPEPSDNTAETAGTHSPEAAEDIAPEPLEELPVTSDIQPQEAEDAPVTESLREEAEEATAPEPPYEEALSQGEPTPSQHLQPPQEAEPISDAKALWDAVLAELRGSMPRFHMAHLSGASSHMDGPSLIISVRDSFAKSSLERNEPQELLRAAIEKAAGRGLPFRIEEAAPEAKPAPDTKAASKLDDLEKFGLKYD